MLVLAPHTDDGEFGCGGTMARLVEAGVEATTTPSRSRPARCRPGFAPDTLAREVREATKELGIPEEQLRVHDFDVRTFPEHRQDILELLVTLWEELKPDAVFQPSPHDVHQDHQTIAQEGLRAFKRTTVLGYEIPWNNFDFSYGRLRRARAAPPREEGRRRSRSTPRSSTAAMRIRSTSGTSPGCTASTSTASTPRASRSTGSSPDRRRYAEIRRLTVRIGVVRADRAYAEARGGVGQSTIRGRVRAT